MINSIIRIAIKHRWYTLLLTTVVAGVGVWSLATMQVDVLPNINKPTVAIFTEGEGLAPEEIERLILTPIEAAVSGAPGVERVRGTASFGLAIVQTEFNWNSDIYRNRQIIQERLANVSLPNGAKPVFGPVSSVMGEIMWAGVSSTKDLSPMELRSLSEWTIRPALMRTPGVSDVIVMGGDVKEWQINLRPEQLRQAGISLEEVAAQIEGALRNKGGGILSQNGKEYPIRILIAPEDINELNTLSVGENDGRIIRLSDVAELREGPSPVRGSASIDGKPGVILRIIKQPEAETLEVTKAIDTTTESLKQSLPEGTVIYSDLFRQEWFIHSGLKNVIDALRDGTILVIIILMIFLFNLRTTSITLTAIPLSILVTAIIFKAFGFSVNVMTLGGIAVAIGELVDDAIVDVENVYRRIIEWREAGKPIPLSEVVFNGSSEVRNSIIYATAIVAIVFLPIFFIPGVEGRLLAPLGLAYIVSLVASLLVSITVTPALCTLLLGKTSKKHQGDTSSVRWIKKVLTPGIRWSIRNPKIMISGLIIGLLVGTGLYLTSANEGIPPFNEDAMTINVLLPVGTALDSSNAFASAVEQKLLKIPEIQRVSHTTGRAGADPHDSGANASEIQIAFKPNNGKERTELTNEVQEIINSFGETASFTVGQPITHRMEELLSGVRAPVVIKVFGDNLASIRSTAESIQQELVKQPGITNPQVQKDITIPEIHLYPDPVRLSYEGLSSGEVAEYLESGLLGKTLGQVQIESEQIDVVLRADRSVRENAAGLKDAFRTPAGRSFEEVGAVRVEEGRNRLSHEGGKRVLIVSANFNGKDIVGAVDTVKKTIESKQLPTGVTVSFEGTYKSQKENSRRLAYMFMLGMIMISLILYHAFRSFPLVLQILLNIPTALIGGIIAVRLTGGEISLAHLIGFISLAGIVSRNGIMLISHCLKLARESSGSVTEETVIKGTLDRVAPVLMTAFTAALALIPFLIGADEPGKEILHPLAVVIFGGLISSTLISLFMTPSMFYRFSKNIYINK